MLPMNQALIDVAQERDEALQRLQAIREASPGWRLVHWARDDNHNLLGLIAVVIAVVGVIGWVFHEKGPKVGLVAILLGIAGVVLFVGVSFLADRRNHEGQP